MKHKLVDVCLRRKKKPPVVAWTVKCLVCGEQTNRRLDRWVGIHQDCEERATRAGTELR